MTDRDPRQTSLFAAAWMIGFVAGTAEAALQKLTVGNLIGRLGLASAELPAELLLHPVFSTARGLAELGGNLRYQCHSSHPDRVVAVAGVDRTGTRVVWLANLTGHKQEAVLHGDLHLHSVLMLDERNFGTGVSEPNNLKGDPAIQLLPYAVACLRSQVP
jgi:hypothetical protein